jgi:hypothetical protein
MSKNTFTADCMHYFDTFRIFYESEEAPLSKYPLHHLNRLPDRGKDYVLVDTEQLSRQYELDKTLKVLKEQPPVEVWDYSKSNCDILKELTKIPVIHVPLKTSAAYKKQLLSWRLPANIKYDVGFSGSSSGRRDTILNKLKEKGITVNNLTCWGEERDKELAKCRIHVNIHYAEDYKIFEQARCEPWLAIGVPIVSEHSLDDDPRCINVPYSELVEAVLQVLHENKTRVVE